MWQLTPSADRLRNCRARSYTPAASPIAMPNLCSLSPVEMYGWVEASTSGFTRIEKPAFTPRRAAIASISASSASDSQLKL